LSVQTERGLAGRTIRGILWNYGSFALSKTVVLVATAILAHLLVPEEFGIVAVATVAVTFLTVLQDLGLGPALIQRRGDIGHAANVVFTLNLLLGFALTAVTFFIAPFVASYFHEPDATSLLRVLGLTFSIEALGAVHLVRLQRSLRFGRVFIPDVGRSVVKGALSIGTAVAGAGAWALIIGQVGGVIAAVILSWMVFPWRPHLEFDRALAGELIGFGLPVFGVDVLFVLAVNLDYVIIGRRLGSEALGIYTLAYRLPELLVLSLMIVVNRVVFPAFSTMQGSREGLRRGFLATTRFTLMATLPMSVGLAIAADPIVRVMLGSEWLDAIPVLRLLAVFVLVASLLNADGDVYKAVGRPDILFKLGLLHLGLLVPGLLIGVRFGLVGVAWGHLVAASVSRFVRIIIIARYLDIPIRVVVSQWRPASVAGLALVGGAAAATLLTSGVGPAGSLVAVAATGAVCYISVLWLVEREGLRALLRAGFSRGGATSSEVDQADSV
jgi:PST family polysaccharide transporter